MENMNEQSKGITYTPETMLYVSPTDGKAAKADIQKIKKILAPFKLEVEEDTEYHLGVTVKVNSDLDCIRIIFNLTGKLSAPYFAGLYTGRKCHYHQEIHCYGHS